MSLLGNQFKDLSIRKLCGILSFRRQSYYSKPSSKEKLLRKHSDEQIVSSFQSVRKEQMSWGYVMIYHYLRNMKGLRFCKKRGHLLYQQAGMSLWRNPKKPRIRRQYQDLIAPAKPNEGWALDFLSEMVVGETGEWYRLLNVVDECSRRSLWLSAEKHMPASKVVEILNNLLEMRGKPRYIRTDNGPEYISEVLAQWADKNKVEHKFIQPGKPTQNGIVERLNGTLRKECLNIQWFLSKDELDEYLDKWYYLYNFERPHSALNFLSPVQFEKLQFSTNNLVA